jgi:hypothetical protein
MAAATGRQQFEYSSIDKHAREIRVLDLLPKLSHDGLIQCSLRTMSLGSASHTGFLNFKALSYAWGDPEERKHQILISGKLFTIRKNLYDFLEVYRKRWATRRTLWIDAICIDQSNITERNHQVWMMGHIYSRAKEVVIWLGLDPCYNRISGLPIVRVLAACVLRWPSMLRVIAGILQMLFRDRIARHRILTLFNARYFTRRWVFAEMLLARKKRVFIGSTSLSWSAMLLLEYFAPHDFAPQLYANQKAITPGTKQPLAQLLTSFSRATCEDPHDLVYAFLGACENGSSFPVDYDCDMLELLFGTALFCLPTKLSKARGLVEERDELDQSSYGGNGYIEDLADHLSRSGQLSPEKTARNGYKRDLIRYTAGTGFYVNVTAELWYEQLKCMKVDSPIVWRYMTRSWPAREGGSLANEEALYLHQVCLTAAITHVLWIPNCSSMVLLSSRTDPRNPGSVFNIRGRFASDEGNETRHVLLEMYGLNGLPGISLEISVGDSKRFLVSDLRSALILFGLPTRSHLRHLRMAALDVLHHRTSFPIGPVRFDRFKYPAEPNQPYTIERTIWLAPGSRARTDLDFVSDGSQLQPSDGPHSESSTHTAVRDTGGRSSVVEN